MEGGAVGVFVAEVLGQRWKAGQHGAKESGGWWGWRWWRAWRTIRLAGRGGGRRKGRKEVRMDRCVVRWGRWRWEAKEGDVLSIGSK
jgi:hypothetical protein